MMRILFIALFLSACVPTAEVQTSAESNARHWTQKMGIETSGVSCSGSDSDRDGYVSCDVNTSQGVKSIECGYTQAIAPMGQNEACKTRMPVTIVPATNAP